MPRRDPSEQAPQVKPQPQQHPSSTKPLPPQRREGVSRQVVRHAVRTQRERATIDFETRSVVDIKVGAWLYAKHPTTKILCLAYHVPGMTRRKLWHPEFKAAGIPATPPPVELLKWIRKGGLVEAHNAMFELCVWHFLCEPMGWPAIPFDNWRCSAAKAAAHALPRKLEEACDALDLPNKKNPNGKRLINQLCKPKKLTKKEKAEFGADAVIFREDRELLLELFEYCGDDVTAEIGLSKEVPDLSPHELAVWQVTQRQNLAGVQIDVDLCRSALRLAAKAKAKLNDELKTITGDPTITATKRAVVKAWLYDNEFVDMPDTKAKTLEFYVDTRPDGLSDRAARILEIVREVNRTSINKYKRMLECVDEHGRARELLVYCGAERTGRFAGRGIQVQNLPKGRFPKWFPRDSAMDVACEIVKTESLEWAECLADDVLNLCASCLRGAIIAGPGKILITADYAAIEARCVLWEAGATKALEVFTKGGDIYCDMASGIYGYVIVKDEKAKARYEAENPGRTATVAKVINSMGSTQRDFGKVAVLGLGYGMGFLKFLITLRSYNIRLTRAEVIQMMGEKRYRRYFRIVQRSLFPDPLDFDNEKKFKTAERNAKISRRQLSDELEDPRAALPELALCKYTVETYRKRYPEVPAMWRAQEEAAIRCIKTGRPQRCGVVRWAIEGRYLTCRLPMGRKLHYADPELKAAKTAWGEVKPSIRFMGRHQKTKKWTRQATYGGKLTENITQAVARDIMCWAKVRLQEHKIFEVILDVHDEIIAEMDAPNEFDFIGANDNYANDNLKEAGALFERVMADMPESLDGCPITAESKTYYRYRK
jgi:DNA polymerase